MNESLTSLDLDNIIGKLIEGRLVLFIYKQTFADFKVGFVDFL
jgi:hypothetical protein